MTGRGESFVRSNEAAPTVLDTSKSLAVFRIVQLVRSSLAPNLVVLSTFPVSRVCSSSSSGTVFTFHIVSGCFSVARRSRILLQEAAVRICMMHGGTINSSRCRHNKNNLKSCRSSCTTLKSNSSRNLWIASPPASSRTTYRKIISFWFLFSLRFALEAGAAAPFQRQDPFGEAVEQPPTSAAGSRSDVASTEDPGLLSLDDPLLFFPSGSGSSGTGGAPSSRPASSIGALEEDIDRLANILFPGERETPRGGGTNTGAAGAGEPDTEVQVSTTTAASTSSTSSSSITLLSNGVQLQTVVAAAAAGAGAGAVGVSRANSKQATAAEVEQDLQKEAEAFLQSAAAEDLDFHFLLTRDIERRCGVRVISTSAPPAAAPPPGPSSSPTTSSNMAATATLTGKGVAELPSPFHVDKDGAKEEYVLRKLEPDDFAKGFKDLLSQLSDTGDLDDAKFRALLQTSNQQVLVVEDVASGKVVCSAALLIEQKFLRGGKKVGHVEDVVTSEKHRRRGLAKTVILQLLEIAKAADCYKTILDCTEANSEVYKKMGFFPTGEIQMRVNL